ncbi:MAG: hypothetical protein LH472_10095 [Pyrinomonadaceae bacterium]|nr:hypothetical protein [Pyrinomonadaceae bacterium]
MAWLTASEYRTLSRMTVSTTAVEQELIDFELRLSIIKICQKCGASIRDEITAAANNLPKTELFRSAQQKLTDAALLPQIGGRIRDGGVPQSERDANGDTTNTYVSIEKLRAEAEAIEVQVFDSLESYYTPAEQAIELFPRGYSSGVKVFSDW